MGELTVRLRPVVVTDVELFRRCAVEPELNGLDWRGFTDANLASITRLVAASLWPVDGSYEGQACGFGGFAVRLGMPGADHLPDDAGA